jgi:hypothetical protein
LNGNVSLESCYSNNSAVLNNLQTALSVPFEGKGGTTGVITLYHLDRNAFNQDDLRILEAASYQIGPAIDAIRLDTNSLEEHLLHHPQIAVLSRQGDVAATEAKLAQANKSADWSVEVAYQQRGSLYSNMISIGVAIPLQWDQKDRQDREVAAKLALAEQTRADRDEMLRAHVGEVRAMIAEWQNGRERLARYARELLPLSSERTRASLAAYSGGRTGLTDLLLARRNEIELRLQAVQLEMETARLWAQLNYLSPETAAK